MSTLAFLLGLSLFHCALSAGEDRRRNPEKFIFDQEAIVTRLEEVLTQLQRQNELVEELKQQVYQSDVTIQEQGHKIAELKESVHLMSISDATGSTRSSIGRNENVMMRNCEEIRTNDPANPSGMYWVDPDGMGSGDPPIFVYCDMTTGTTVVSHDSEFLIEVDPCPDPGCSARVINYNATLRQLVALTEMSHYCQQFIQFDCFGVPLEYDGVAQSWWSDRSGHPQFYWAGGNNTKHTCQCGMEKACDDPSMTCNCNSLADVELSDQGFITNKEALPVTKLNVGGITDHRSYGRYILGKLECSGREHVNGIPESCSDLWKMGHTLNGFYDVKRVNEIVKVYCDFTQVPGVKGVEMVTGAMDVKTPVYFYVQRQSQFSDAGSVIPFQIERLNMGSAMNLSSGVFTAPKSGVYIFTFSGLKSSSPAASIVQLQHNGVSVGSSWAPGLPNYFTMTLSSTLELKQGDQIQLLLQRGQLFDDGSHYTHFTGKLLQEELFQ